VKLRWFYDRRDIAEVRRDLAEWLAKWQDKYPKLFSWVEDNIEEMLTFYRLPLALDHMKSAIMLERLNQEIKWARMWCGSFRMWRAVYGQFARWRSKRTRTGWKRSGI
jgi:transposase-like protein